MMSTTDWQPLDSNRRALTARYRFPGGVSRTVLLRLGERRWLAYSPGRSLVELASSVIDPADEVLLVSPSAGHSMGLEPWKERFPSARVFATHAARPRLQRVTSIDTIATPSELAAQLPDNVQVHVPTSKTGELWVSTDFDDRRYWLVCDSFFNLPKLADAFWLRLAQRLYGLRIGLDVGRIFRWGIKDKAAFRAWVVERFSTEHRHVLVPCHGEVDDDPDIADRVLALTHERF